MTAAAHRFERPGASDLLLAGVATHKVSRLLAKDRVTSFLRAPFTRHQWPAGHGEVEEEAEGTGLPRAVAELLTELASRREAAA